MFQELPTHDFSKKVYRIFCSQLIHLILRIDNRHHGRLRPYDVLYNQAIALPLGFQELIYTYLIVYSDYFELLMKILDLLIRFLLFARIVRETASYCLYPLLKHRHIVCFQYHSSWFLSASQGRASTSRWELPQWYLCPHEYTASLCI